MRAYERLIRYSKYPTASNENCPDCPSSPAQLVLAGDLVKEMKELGIENAAVDEHGYVYGTIPANIPDWDGSIIGFIAHMDVVDVVMRSATPCTARSPKRSAKARRLTASR